MPKAGHGKRSGDLPNFSYHQLEQFYAWLDLMESTLAQGRRQSAKMKRLAPGRQRERLYDYYRHATKAARWIRHQLLYVMGARMTQEMEARDALSRNVAVGVKRLHRPSA